ncbi:uncharacterized protein LOC130010441 [Patella vulgata]|uniref:uncharacterized protein LOC130010441 n=1 Tax=Patella vulgata TaxID=6465 RepID=UPI0024A99B9E|nr:uncharacterized protein LOC130010441 [Patella vulgata]XP_055957381.1 uncharacterized protein LOC130010441 [Patella vulgata]
MLKNELRWKSCCLPDLIKKVLQDHIRQSTGKNITLKDITNHAQRLIPKPKNLEQVLTKLQSSDKTIQVLTKDDTLEAIYYQDEVMKKKYDCFPELLLVDVTYKLNDLRMPVFLQLIVDGNGESEIVCVYIVVSEFAETMTKLVQIFKNENKAWEKTKTVMTDDFMERAVYGEQFPDAQFQLCLFPVLRSVKREINVEKMNIRLEQKDHCLEIIQKLAYSNCEDEYQRNFDNLRDTGVQPVIDYFTNSWHPIRNQWVVGLKDSCHYNNQTNNRLESINQKLKQVIKKFSNLEEFFDDLELVIRCLQNK